MFESSGVVVPNVVVAVVDILPSLALSGNVVVAVDVVVVAAELVVN